MFESTRIWMNTLYSRRNTKKSILNSLHNIISMAIIQNCHFGEETEIVHVRQPFTGSFITDTYILCSLRYWETSLASSHSHPLCMGSIPHPPFFGKSNTRIELIYFNLKKKCFVWNNDLAFIIKKSTEERFFSVFNVLLSKFDFVSLFNGCLNVQLSPRYRYILIMSIRFNVYWITAYEMRPAVWNEMQRTPKLRLFGITHIFYACPIRIEVEIPRFPLLVVFDGLFVHEVKIRLNGAAGMIRTKKNTQWVCSWDDLIDHVSSLFKFGWSACRYLSSTNLWTGTGTGRVWFRTLCFMCKNCYRFNGYIREGRKIWRAIHTLRKALVWAFASSIARVLFACYMNYFVYCWSLCTIWQMYALEHTSKLSFDLLIVCVLGVYIYVFVSHLFHMSFSKILTV